LGGAIIRALSEPVVTDYRSIIARTVESLAFGSHAPVRCGFEEIIRVGDAFASQMAFSNSCKNRYHSVDVNTTHAALFRHRTQVAVAT
jgi:hypothetical protein